MTGPSTPCAYIVLSHGSGDHARRLVDVLVGESPSSRVVVHHDAASPALTWATRPRVTLIPSQPIRRGDLSIVRATVAALHELERTSDYAWVTLLSARDYPVAPLATIETALRTAPWDGFVRVRLTREHARLIRRRYPRVPGLARPYKASQWWTLARPVVRHLLDWIDAHPDVWSTAGRAVIPDEFLLQSIVLNGPHRIALDNHRYVTWAARGDRHPRELTIDDIQRARDTGAWFVRKVDAITHPDVMAACDAARSAGQLEAYAS